MVSVCRYGYFQLSREAGNGYKKIVNEIFRDQLK